MPDLFHWFNRTTGRNIILLIWTLVPLSLLAQSDTITSRVYDWQVDPGGVVADSSIMFEGSTRDMQWMQLTAHRIRTGKNLSFQIPGDQEYLVIIRSGTLHINHHESYQLGKGSIGLFIPGDNFSIANDSTEMAEYYLLKYTSKEPDISRGKIEGSLIKDWKEIVYKTHERGGIRNFFQRPTAMSKRMEMHASNLNAGIKSHEPHTHRAAEIVVMLEGNTEMQINQNFYKGKPGSVFFLGSESLHAIRNEGKETAIYFAFQFE